MTRPVLWLNDPLAADLLRRTGWPALYDITDDWLLADRSPREHDRLVESERYLLDHCRHVVVCSPRLLETKSPGRRNGSRWSRTPWTSTPTVADAPRPATCRRGRWCCTSARCTATGSTWTSASTLASGLRGDATSCSSVRWPWTPPTRRSLADAGALLLGPREHATVPAYLKNADVLVVPHVVTDFTDSLDPIKVYEYLAAARPVVSTPVAGFRELDLDHVAVVPGSGLLQAVSQALATGPVSSEETHVPSWDERAGVMRRIIDETRGP